MELKINNIVYKNPLFVFALEAEAGSEFNECSVVFTGVGKINATYSLCNGIAKFSPDIVINLGTAGGFGLERGEVVCCTNFIQRDMDVTPLGFDKYITPFEDSNAILSYGLEMQGLKKSTCGTGDCFEMNHNTDLYDVVDMEAYALAKVCQSQNIPFLCLKYISDGADDNAVDDWSKEVKLASKRLKESLVN